MTGIKIRPNGYEPAIPDQSSIDLAYGEDLYNYVKQWLIENVFTKLLLQKVLIVCMCVYVCMYVCMYVCTCVRMYVCTYVCMYVCIYVCMYVANCHIGWMHMH